MSTVRLLKDHPKYGKAGTVNTAVPFLEARNLVASGHAERPGLGSAPADVLPGHGPNPPAVPAPGTTVPAAEHHRALEQIERQGEEITRLTAENEELARGLDEATKPSAGAASKADLDKALARLKELEAENGELASRLKAGDGERKTLAEKLAKAEKDLAAAKK